MLGTNGRCEGTPSQPGSELRLNERAEVVRRTNITPNHSHGIEQRGRFVGRHASSTHRVEYYADRVAIDAFAPSLRCNHRQLRGGEDLGCPIGKLCVRRSAPADEQSYEQ